VVATGWRNIGGFTIYGFRTLKQQILLVGIRGREKPLGTPGLRGGLSVTLTTWDIQGRNLGWLSPTFSPPLHPSHHAHLPSHQTVMVLPNKSLSASTPSFELLPITMLLT